VCKTVFDHTSIIKTILTRHRAQIHSENLTRFGPRVNQANHLGFALQKQPRTFLAAPTPSGPAPPTSRKLSVAEIAARRGKPRIGDAGDPKDFRASLCRAMLPFPRG
jgi:hypothetical protein